VKALRKVDTLIIGGYDRGIEYGILIDFLRENPVPNLVFTGPAGKRIFNEWKPQGNLPEAYILEDDFRKIVDFIFEKTEEGRIALLSPAAASYDQFKNFEERGRIFKQYIIEKSKTL